jgi:hypothetical protein
MSANRERCFVIMPFSGTFETHTEDYRNGHFENFLKPLIESCDNVEAFRSQPLRQDLLRQIVNDLVFSQIVVADLTDANPNVYWELGVRLSFRHGTVTIANEGSKIPFDIATKSVLFYPSDLKKRDDFSKQFKDAIADCVSNPDRPDSFVLEAITGRGSVYAVIHQAEMIRRIDGLISENEANKEIFGQMIETIVENRSIRFAYARGKAHIVLVSLFDSAISLLLAERYLEENAEFYEFVHQLLVAIHAVNRQIATWGFSGKNTDEYFLKNRTLFESLFVQYQNRLVDIRKKLVSIC